MTARSPIALSLFLSAAVVLSGQQAPAPPAQTGQPPVTFRVEVNYVEIDAVVTDAQGRVVRDLTKDDFEVLESNKPQALNVVTLVDIPVERPDAPLYSPTAIEPDVSSNMREFDGRIFALVMDDTQTLFARSARVKQAATQFIERYIGTNDLAAVITTGGSRYASQEFTGNRRLLLRAVDGFSGQKIRSATLDKIDDYYVQQATQSGNAPTDVNDTERSYRARNSLSTLESVSKYLAGVRGRRKAIVYFSEGIDYDIENPIANRYATDIRDAMQRVIAEATRANVSIYGVDPRGLGGVGDEVMAIQSLPGDPTLGLGATSLHDELRRANDSLRVLSDETGGFATVSRNDLRDTFGRIVADNSTYYLLGYYSADTRRDGKFRDVQIRVKRPGLNVRARRGYVAPRGKAPEPGRDKETSAALREVLESPVPVSGLGLRLFVAPLKGAAPDASVSVTLEVDGRDLTFAQESGLFLDDLEISAIAIDQTGKIKEGGHDTVNLKLRPQTHDLVSRSGVRVARRLDLPPGKYQLRVGARETRGGALGSVLYDLEVPDFTKGDLAMSGLFVASAAAARLPSVNPDPDLKDVLPSPPAAGREFPAGDTLALFTEIYDNQRAPHRVAITATVKADDGRAVFNSSDERSNAELTGGKGGGYGYTTTIPLKDVPAGRYVLRVEARSLLDKGPSTFRELEFRVR